MHEAANAHINTFEVVARERHSVCAQKWKLQHHEATVLRRMELRLFPALGNGPVVNLKARDLLATLKTAEWA